MGACILMGFIVLTGVEELIDSDSGSTEGVEYYIHLDSHFFFALPIICFSFQVHVVCVPVYHEMKDPSPKKMSTAIIWTMIICLVVYSLVGMKNILKTLLSNSYLFL